MAKHALMDRIGLTTPGSDDIELAIPIVVDQCRAPSGGLDQRENILLTSISILTADESSLDFPETQMAQRSPRRQGLRSGRKDTRTRRSNVWPMAIAATDALPNQNQPQGHKFRSGRSGRSCSGDIRVQ
jgi:hypothetical protein